MNNILVKHIHLSETKQMLLFVKYQTIENADPAKQSMRCKEKEQSNLSMQFF